MTKLRLYTSDHFDTPNRIQAYNPLLHGVKLSDGLQSQFFAKFSKKGKAKALTTMDITGDLSFKYSYVFKVMNKAKNLRYLNLDLDMKKILIKTVLNQIRSSSNLPGLKIISLTTSYKKRHDQNQTNFPGFWKRILRWLQKTRPLEQLKLNFDGQFLIDDNFGTLRRIGLEKLKKIDINFKRVNGKKKIDKWLLHFGKQISRSICRNHIKNDDVPKSCFSISITSLSSEAITPHGIVTFLTCFEKANMLIKLSLSILKSFLCSSTYDHKTNDNSGLGDLLLYISKKSKRILLESLSFSCDDEMGVSLESFLESSHKLCPKYLKLDLRHRNFEEAKEFAEIFHLIKAEKRTEIRFPSEIPFEKDYNDSYWDDFDSEVGSVEERNCLEVFVEPFLTENAYSEMVKFDFSATTMKSNNFNRLAGILRDTKSKIERLEIKVGLPYAEEVDEYFFGLEMGLLEDIVKLTGSLQNVISFEVDLNELISLAEEREKPKFKIDQKQAKKSQLEHITLNLERCDIRPSILRAMIEPFKYFQKIKDVIIKCSKDVYELYNQKNILKSPKGRVIPCHFIIKK